MQKGSLNSYTLVSTEKETATDILEGIFEKYYQKKCPNRSANEFIIKVSGM